MSPNLVLRPRELTRIKDIGRRSEGGIQSAKRKAAAGPVNHARSCRLAIRESFGMAGFPVPEQHVVLRNGNAIAAGLPIKEAFAGSR